MRFDDQRKKMVETQLVKAGISDQRVLNAFLKVPRENFVSEQWKDFTYLDYPISIGNQQTLSQPFIVAKMLTLLELKETDEVLEIGTGSGYQTALLAELVSAVYTIERIESLLKSAKKILKKLDYNNIYFKMGDGCLGWVNVLPEKSEFDKIIVSAGSAELPQVLLNQLKVGGKLIIPQGTMSEQKLIVYEKKEDEIVTQAYIKCVFVPLIGVGAWDI